MANSERGSKIMAKTTAMPPRPRATGSPRKRTKKRLKKYSVVMISILTVSPFSFLFL